MTAAAASERLVWRVRQAAVCVALAAVAFRQKPGLVVADTKLDLTQDPWRFLGRSLHLWDPAGAFGQLQNQAYGYLFPMGPFHGVLLSAGVPAWVTQRLWWTVLLCTAFLGTWRVLGALRVGTPWTRLVGAATYALCPRLASELTITSVEVWPMAVAPWVLWPLVARGARSWRWRILWSAAALACCGGVNAVATGAALVLPALWFLTRRPSRRVALAFAGWLGASVLAMAWWLAPLVILGRYSPPFLDWIEGSAVTSSTASAYEAFKGTSAWLAFLRTDTGPQWPGGWLYVTVPVLVVSSTLLAACGLVGIALRRTPERLFLVVAVVAGLVLLTAGHTPGPAAPWAPAWQEVMDRGLAAFRNTHKFDVVLRLPLTVGLVSALTAVAERARAWGARTWVVPVVAVSVVVSATAPALVANLARSEAYPRVPSYWSQAAHWLDAQPQPGAALVLPASSFADFTWGSTKDNPLQALMRRPLVVRDAVPLGSAGATRFLDGIQRQVGAGRGGTGLARAMATAGVRYVVVPNDLRLDAAGAPLVAVHTSLQQSGLHRVSYFGPAAGNAFETDTHTVDYRTLVARPSVEIYEVPGTSQARTSALAAVARGTGGPEDAAALQDAGIQLALLGTDDPRSSPATTTVATDGLRRREVEFGRPTDNTSSVLTREEPTRQRRAVTDFVADPRAPRTVTAWSGVRGVSASSSASDAGASLRLGPAADPGAALDGDPGTRWVSGTFGGGVGEWWQVDLLGGQAPSRIRAVVSTASPVAARPTQVEVRTASGARRVDLGDASVVTTTLPPGPVRWVRITLTKVAPGAVNGFALSDVYLDGVTAREGLEVPVPPDGVGPPARIVLRRELAGRSGCVTSSGIGLCAPSNTQQPEGPGLMRRSLVVGTEGTYAMSGRVSARGRGADQLLDLPGYPTATASSRLVDSPADRPGAAVDGDVETGWVAGRLDLHPELTVTLPERRVVRGLQFLRGPHLAAARPERVRVHVDDNPAVEGVVDDEGYVRFGARRGRKVVVSVLTTRPFINVDSSTGARTFVPVGVSELRVLGADDLRRPPRASSVVGVPCGFGPELEVNGVGVPTSVSGTFADLAADRALEWRACKDPVSVRRGSNVVQATPSAEFVPEDLVLERTAAGAVEGAVDGASPPVDLSTPTTLVRTGPAEMVVPVSDRTGDTVVAVPQNFNAGWRATVEGRAVAPIRVNGWMQGWLVPAGAATSLQAHFAPDVPYRWALLLGALALLGLLVPAVSAARRTQRGRVPEGPGDLSAGVAIAATSVAGLALAGWWGLGIGLALAVVAHRVARAPRPAPGRARIVTGLLVGTLPVCASLLDVTSPWPTGRGAVEAAWSQALIAVPTLLAVAMVLCWGPPVVQGRARGRRSPGRARDVVPSG